MKEVNGRAVLRSGRCDELGRMTSKTVTSDEYDPDKTVIDRGFDYEPDWVTGQYTRTGPDGVETFVQLDAANRVQSYRRGPARASSI